MSSNDRDTRSTLRYVGLGSQMMAMLLAGVWGGWKLDGWIGWEVPVLTIVLPLIALCYSLYQIIREFNKKTK